MIILARNRSLPALRNFYTTSRKNANLIEKKKDITAVVQLKENNIKSFRSYLTINRHAILCYTICVQCIISFTRS